MYMFSEVMSLLDGFVDLYLNDFKFGNNECASRLSNTDNCMDGRNHKIAKSKNMIIHHLVLPNHFECCSMRLMNWINDNLERCYFKYYKWISFTLQI